MIDYYGVTFDHLVPPDDTNPEVLQINIVEIGVRRSPVVDIQRISLFTLQNKDTPQIKREKKDYTFFFIVYGLQKCLELAIDYTQYKNLREPVCMQIV
jgi:hypothetical protein